jgi:DNA-binding beta-propeller fold protein YncE
VAQGNGVFTAPNDVVASPDGKTFYFSAHSLPDPDRTAGIFSVLAKGGDVQTLVVSPLLRDPTLVMSCDGKTLYVADAGYEPGLEGSALYSISTSGGDLTSISVPVVALHGLAMHKDCETLYATGIGQDNVPSLFKLAGLGTGFEVVAGGFESPTGVYVDHKSVAWVMDARFSRSSGGALLSVKPDGTTTTVVDGLSLSAHAGVSLTQDGRDAVMPSRAEDEGKAGFVLVNIDSGENTSFSTDKVHCEGGGIRVARDKDVFALVDPCSDEVLSCE